MRAEPRDALGSSQRVLVVPSIQEPVLHTFSPREVQARVRAGESAADVAASTGWDLDKVLRYAEPLLAERAFIAQQALAVELRRSRGGATLAETAEASLGADFDATVWDAHRRDDGRWVVSAVLADGTTALWTYDHHGRTVHPLDEEARRLMGVAPADTTPGSAEVDIAEALDLAASVPVVREDAGSRPHLVAVPSPSESAPAQEEQAAAEASSGSGYEQETIVIPREASAPESEPEGTPAAAAPRTPARKTRSKKGRTSVPSWDEILFGAGRSDD